MPRLMYDRILKQTRKAIQYQFGDKKVWIPISQLEKEICMDHIIEIPDWLVKAKELQGEVR